MDLDEGALKLIDPENLTVLNTQPIHTIRVWGVGRDNGRYGGLQRHRTLGTCPVNNNSPP